MKRKIWFYRQLLSYIPPFFIIVTFIFFVYYQSLSDQSQKEAAMANKSLLLQTMNSVDSTLEEVKQELLSELLHNNELFLFYYAGKQENNYYLNIQVAEFMRSFKEQHPLVDSIYVIRTHNPLVISDASMSKPEEYPDYEFIKPYLKQSGAHWTGIRDFMEFSVVGNRRQVVTLILKAPFTEVGDGLIIVNLSPVRIAEMITSIYDQKVSYIRILDDGDKEIIAIPNSEGKNDTVISRAISPLNHWMYLSGPINGKFASATNWLHDIWFVVGGIMIIAGMVWFFFVTRRSYKPIEQIVSRINSMSQTKAVPEPQGDRKKQDEFAFIESAISSMLAQTKSYQQQYREDLQLKKNFLFQQVLVGQFPVNLAQWDAQKEKIQLNDLRKNQVVCLAEIDNYHNFNNKYMQHDQNLLRFVIKSVIQETAQNCIFTVWAGWITNSKLGVMMQLEEEQDTEKQVYKLFEDTMTWIEQNIKMTITVSVGLPALDYTHIPQSYIQALQALKYKMVLGGNQIIFYSQVVRNKKGESYDYFQLVHAMALSLRMGRPEWREQYKTMMSNIERDSLDFDKIHSLLDFTIYSIDKEIQMMPHEVRELWSSTGMPSLNEALSSSDTLAHLDQRMEQAIEQLFLLIRQSLERRSAPEIIEKIRECIEEEYSNPNLSLDYLSERFKMNPKMISRLFKEVTGQKFVDYLIELRIKQAQTLLEQTSQSINEIAEEVGYLNVISFGRAFKKILNISPGEYRKLVRN